MFTSIAENRILLRQYDADARLTEKSYTLGLVKKERYDWWIEKKTAIKHILDYCNNTSVKAKDINYALQAIGTTPLRMGCKISDIIGMQQVELNYLANFIPNLKEIINTLTNRKEEIIEASEINIKYKGYIERERMIAEKMQRLEDIKIKDRFKYKELHELSTEARQKLERINPETLAQASRIPGISPSDINVLLILLGR